MRDLRACDNRVLYSSFNSADFVSVTLLKLHNPIRFFGVLSTNTAGNGYPKDGRPITTIKRCGRSGAKRGSDSRQSPIFMLTAPHGSHYVMRAYAPDGRSTNDSRFLHGFS
jgi:hypothetical protein